MARKPKAYVAALPLSSLPELQELLSRFCGGEAPRGNVVMVRLGDAAVTALDQLVEAALFAAAAPAAAFLLGAGIEAQHELFARVGKHSAEIEENPAIFEARRTGGAPSRRIEITAATVFEKEQGGVTALCRTFILRKTRRGRRAGKHTIPPCRWTVPPDTRSRLRGWQRPYQFILDTGSSHCLVSQELSGDTWNTTRIRETGDGRWKAREAHVYARPLDDGWRSAAS